MIKLIGAQLIKSTDDGYLLDIELVDGTRVNTWFPRSDVSIEEDELGNPCGDIYAELWIIERKEEQGEVDDYIDTDRREL